MSIFENLHIPEPPPRPLTPYQHALTIAKREGQWALRLQAYDLSSALRARMIEAVAHRLSEPELQHVVNVFNGGEQS